MFVTLHIELAKLIPNIHYTSDGKDLELQHTFAIKLRSDLQAEIISREFKYADLQEIIQRYEKIHTPSNANWIGNLMHDTRNQRQIRRQKLPCQTQNHFMPLLQERQPYLK